MIKANELRIGNWVEDNVEYVQVTKSFMSYLLSQAMTFRNIDEADFKSVNPIPLTPEILEKAGFERHETDTLFRRNTFYLHRYVFGGIKMDGNEYCFKYNNYRSSSIIHLHQLQNLYFSLTGQELEIDLQKQTA